MKSVRRSADAEPCACRAMLGAVPTGTRIVAAPANPKVPLTCVCEDSARSLMRVSTVP